MNNISGYFSPPVGWTILYIAGCLLLYLYIRHTARHRFLLPNDEKNKEPYVNTIHRIGIALFLLTLFSIVIAALLLPDMATYTFMALLMISMIVSELFNLFMWRKYASKRAYYLYELWTKTCFISIFTVSLLLLTFFYYGTH